MSTEVDVLRDLIQELEGTDNTQKLESLKAKFLGKDSYINQQLLSLKTLNIEEKKVLGNQVNSLKIQLSNLIEKKQHDLLAQQYNNKLLSEKIDTTVPGIPHNLGSIHPITATINRINDIFSGFGFESTTGDDIEDSWHNFTALNIPEHHPAREMHDTFFLKNNDLLLRTHTSPVQIHTMLETKPPIRCLSIGRVYRCDSDMTHTPMFHQAEGLVVDKEVNMGHLKGILTMFINLFFEGQKINLRFRPSYFPFTEPSAEVDISIGDNGKFLEVLGCGMVHPNVLRNCGIDPKEYQGFAFGLGIERFAMLKYNITDLRPFFHSDLRWMKQHSFSAYFN